MSMRSVLSRVQFWIKGDKRQLENEERYQLTMQEYNDYYDPYEVEKYGMEFVEYQKKQALEHGDSGK